MAVILIVDDSSFQRGLLAKILREHGFEILEAKTGKEGIALAMSQKPDVMLLDLLMPEMDGYEVLKEVKEKGIGIPIMMVTSDIQETTKRQCSDLGATGFINKPVHEDELIGGLKDILRKGEA